MQIDIITIIISAISIITMTLMSLLNPFFKSLKQRKRNENTTLYPSISVILTPYKDAVGLQNSIDSLSMQEYEGEFNIIVVIQKGNSEVEDVVKRNASNNNIYSTFVPNTSRYISKNKLAITIGVKASQYNWIVLMKSGLKAQNNSWLKTISEQLQENKDVAIINTKFNADSPHFAQYERQYELQYNLKSAQNGYAFRASSNCIAFKKDLFIEEKGYGNSLKYTTGEYDFIINRFAKNHNTAYYTDDNATLIEEYTPEKSYKSEKTNYQETRKHLQRKSLNRFKQNLDQFILHGGFAIFALSFLYGLYVMNYIIMATALLCGIFSIIIKFILTNKFLKEKCVYIPLWKTFFFELSIMWSRIFAKIRYLSTDKSDFISHKI